MTKEDRIQIALGLKKKCCAENCSNVTESNGATLGISTLCRRHHVKMMDRLTKILAGQRKERKKYANEGR